MGDNLPVVHDREVPNCREAENEDKAIAIDEYHSNKAIAMGDVEKEEWIIAPNAYGLDDMR